MLFRSFLFVHLAYRVKLVRGVLLRARESRLGFCELGVGDEKLFLESGEAGLEGRVGGGGRVGSFGGGESFLSSGEGDGGGRDGLLESRDGRLALG